VKKPTGKESAILLAFKSMDHDNLEVNLTSKNIGDSQVNEIIKGLKTYGGLRSLDLSGNKITDEGV
jgi:Leucine-rich repeat (LRR) protein